MTHRCPLLACPLLACLLLIAGCPAMAADTANIHISGTVLAGTCTTAGDARVTIPDIQAGRHPSGRISKSATAFNMVLSGCSGVTKATLSFGSASDAQAKQQDTFRNQAVADAVGTLSLWLQKGACTANGNTIAPGSKKIYDINGTSLSVPLCITYWNFGGDQASLSPGHVQAAIRVNITYQ